MAKVTCYHGTTSKKVQSILQEGFKPDTWFALHLEDALFYGGSYVFEVSFQSEKIPQDTWQFHVLDAVPVEQIKQCSIFLREIIYKKAEENNG